MNVMSIQDRYNDISKKSGLSEEIIRRVFKATRESLATSLKKGDRGTIPGICTMIPEMKSKLNIGGESVTRYIKVKCIPSSAMETELSKINQFNDDNEAGNTVTDEEVMTKLQFIEHGNFRLLNENESGIRTAQISALL